MSGPSVRELARVSDPLVRRVAGMVRRLTVSVTTSPIWKLLGVQGLDGANEVIHAEAFGQLGMYARPRTSGGSPEAIVVHVGDARVPVMVACRDEKTLAAVREALGGIDAGEAVIYTPNGEAVIHMTSGGGVEVKSPGGTAVALATLADVEAIVTAYNGHSHADPVSGYVGAPVTAPAGTPRLSADPDGTSVLKGE